MSCEAETATALLASKQWHTNRRFDSRAGPPGKPGRDAGGVQHAKEQQAGQRPDETHGFAFSVSALVTTYRQQSAEQTSWPGPSGPNACRVGSSVSRSSISSRIIRTNRR